MGLNRSIQSGMRGLSFLLIHLSILDALFLIIF